MEMGMELKPLDKWHKFNLQWHWWLEHGGSEVLIFWSKVAQKREDSHLVLPQLTSSCKIVIHTFEFQQVFIKRGGQFFPQVYRLEIILNSLA